MVELHRDDLLVSLAGRLQRRLGFNVAVPVHPGHGSRRSQWPPYPDLDPLTNVAGMMRAVSEVLAVMQWVQPQSTAVVVSGVSMGSAVAALVSHFEMRVECRRAVHADLGPQRDDRASPRALGSVARWLPRALAVAGRLGIDLSDRCAVGRARAAAASSAHRRSVARPDGDARARRCVAVAMERPVLLVRQQSVGHIFSRRVQAVSERFLREVALNAPNQEVGN